MKLALEDSSTKVQSHRALLTSELLDHKRTRFFVAYAHRGIRLAALLFLVASHTRRARKDGKRGQRAGWRQTADWFGAQIGISGRQVYRLVAQGKKFRLLDSLRTRRGIVLWITERKVYSQPSFNEEDRFSVGHYYLRLSRVLGMNGSILYRFLKAADDEGCRRRLTAQSTAHRFSWMSVKAASMELGRLFNAGVINRDRAKFALSANADWVYYWCSRTADDRRKWQSKPK